jgi:hypothetical protein
VAYGHSTYHESADSAKTDRPALTNEQKRYGLRCRNGARFCHLIQISGGGRLLVGPGDRMWWTKRAKVGPWEVYEASDGHVLDSPEEAHRVAQNLAMK